MPGVQKFAEVTFIVGVIIKQDRWDENEKFNKFSFKSFNYFYDTNVKC